MSYAGNPSLSSDIQNRVLGTFEQTLGLAAEGSRQEALLGCDFVLRMDPHFEPARQLQERLRNSAGPVSVDDLLAPATLDPFAGAIDLPDLPAFGGASAPAGDLRSRFQSLLNGRQFQELMTLAQQNQAAVGADPELMRIASEAQERLEAAPYVNKFVNAAREAARQGNREETARAVEKIRTLDPSHPAIAELSGVPAAPATSAMQAPPPVTAMPAMPAADPFASAEPFPAMDAGFDLSLDEPSLDTGFGTELPELSFDEPLLGFEETPAAPSLMDPELVSAADFQTDMLASSSSSGDSETDRRIKQLLDEGQTAYQAGDVQGAIDAWSRIFLIDIDHQEAARRIEQARKVKAESERQAEEVFHEALGKMEAGDLEGAKQTLHRVLEIQPSYFAAREYLQQLEAGQVPSTRPAPRHDPAAQALPTPSDLDLETATGELKEEILIPPDPSELATAERQKPKAKAKTAPVREGKARKTFVLVGSAVLVLALAGGAFVYLNKDRLFPNSQTEDPAAAQASGQDPIARAMDLHKGGKTQIAVAQLRRLPPDDPAYAKAQELISQWDTSPAPAPGVPGGAPPAPAAPVIPPERLALLTSARDAYQGRSYLEAIERYEVAQQKGRLDPSDAQMLADARRQLEPISSQINLVEQHEWEVALRDLWRLHEADPGNRDVTRLMVDSYYNLALRDLQRMDAKQALQNFREAQGLDPNDSDLQRQIAFAESYQTKNKDMLYRIYVKHLPLR